MSGLELDKGDAGRGIMLVISSPSGAGKSTLARMLVEREQNIQLSISTTTRRPRQGEQDGVDYNFIDEEKFRQMREAGEFIESAIVFDHLYGTPRAPVEKMLAAGKDVIFDVDWQGTRQLRSVEISKDAVVSLFLLPPSRVALEQRLLGRCQDSQHEVDKRMQKADGEISHWHEYDYVLINDDIEHCYRQVIHILRAEHMRRSRNQHNLAQFVEKLYQ